MRDILPTSTVRNPRIFRLGPAMPTSKRRAPSPFLLEPGYWRERLAQLESVSRGLLILPRPDLSSPLVEVTEWRLKAHDGQRLWGLRGQSPFHPSPKGIRLREVEVGEPPEILLDVVAEGFADFVFPVHPGRRLEDRVLDVLRVLQIASHLTGLGADLVKLSSGGAGQERDEFMIVGSLFERGFC